jgi:hypothetical protein
MLTSVWVSDASVGRATGRAAHKSNGDGAGKGRNKGRAAPVSARPRFVISRRAWDRRFEEDVAAGVVSRV